MSPEISPKNRAIIISATLLTLFVSALDTLVMSAAMPTILSDLGGLSLYSWVFSSYLLARAVSMPIFGKLADLFSSRRLYNLSIGIFLAGSMLAGISRNMTQLIIFRAFQGIGAGGIFSLVYIVLAGISSPENRGKTLSLASFIWGLASVLGPTIGGFIVSYFSWRWIFYINIPVGVLSIVGVSLYLVDFHESRKTVAIDVAGALTLSVTIIALLTTFLMIGRGYAWRSAPIFILELITVLFGLAFAFVERRAPDPILALNFFKVRGFSFGNGAGFCASFAVFSFFAYSPLFIQGALGKTPMELGLAMLVLSLAWSVASLVCGQLINRLGQKPSAIIGALFLAAGCGLTLTFSSSTKLIECIIVFAICGTGMGFITFATLLVVQDSLEPAHLGIATASNQFARTLGGTIGIGIAGGLLSAKMAGMFADVFGPAVREKIPHAVFTRLQESPENLFLPEVQSLLEPSVLSRLQEAVGQDVIIVFWTCLFAALVALALALGLPKGRR